MPAGGGEPPRPGFPGLTLVVARLRHDLMLHRQREEPADGPLAALVVGVEQLQPCSTAIPLPALRSPIAR